MRLLSTSEILSATAQRRFVFEAGRRLQKTSHLIWAQYDRHLARLVNERHLPAEIGAIERHVEEEPQRRDRRIDLGRVGSALR